MLDPYLGLFIVFSLGKVGIYACLYRSNGLSNLLTDVALALTRMTVMLTFAKHAGILRRVSRSKEPAPMCTLFRLTSALQNFKPYERQNDSLEDQLSSLLRSLVPPKKVSATTAEEIVNFFIGNDAAGRKQLHVRSWFRYSCGCPKHVAAGTVDSYVGYPRVIFIKLGHTGFSNPLAHPCVKEYLNFAREEKT